MADAVTAQLRGHDYQGLLFWLEATLLLDLKSNVVRVTYEAKGPKAFDDVVVEYDPAVVMGGSDRVSATYISSKWKTTSADRFGHLDLAEPAFIGATSVSFLQRLKDAQEALAPTGAGIRFQLVTPARIADADDLRKLVSMYNRAFLVDSLLDGTGDHSWTGRIRHVWRRHLGLASDDELRPILSLLQIYDGHASTLELINRVNDRLRSVGLTTIDASRTDNRYDDLIHKLKGRGINTFDRTSFRALCADEGLFAMTHTAGALPSVKRIAIRSFIDFGEVVEAQADSTLVLTNEFQQRYIAKDDGWRLAIQPKVEQFLRDAVRGAKRIQLVLDAHASIAFVAGALIHTKTGVAVEFVQKTRGIGERIWRVDEPPPPGSEALVSGDEGVAPGQPDIALAIGISNPVLEEVRRFVGASLLSVGRIVSFVPKGGPSQQAVKNGGHAARMAEQIANELRSSRTRAEAGSTIHIFASCPNALLFYLGQQSRGFGRVHMYEFDFERHRHKTYQLSIVLGEKAP
jgi:SMODS-associated and fused to various effectors sensor domain